MSAFPTNRYTPSDSPPRLLASVSLLASDQTIYATPAGKRATVTLLVVCNTNGTATTFRIHHVAPGKSSAASNAQYWDTRIASGQTVLDDSPRALLPGDELRGKGGTASWVTVSVYGVETAVG